MQRTRSKIQGGPPLHQNVEIAHALHSIQHILDQHQLVWHDQGRHPDCQFTSFIHATKKTVEILTVRRACRNWLLANPPPLVESVTAWCDRIKAFGLGTEKRKQGDEHSLRGLAGAFATSINVIIVTTLGYRTVQYNPPNNRPHSEVIWLIYLDLEHIRHITSQ